MSRMVGFWTDLILAAHVERKNLLDNIFNGKLLSPYTARKTKPQNYSKLIYRNTFYFPKF